MRKQRLKQMCGFLKSGVVAKRTKQHKRGPREAEEVFLVPEKGYLFKPRAKASAGHLHYHAVYDRVRRPPNS